MRGLLSLPAMVQRERGGRAYEERVRREKSAGEEMLATLSFSDLKENCRSKRRIWRICGHAKRLALRPLI